MQNRTQKLRLLLALTRRDYVVQFAGAGLGIGWLFIQYLFQIALFFLIFGVVLGGENSSDLGVESRRLTGPGFLNYLLAAMTLWLPLSEMVQRSGSILSENRSLIRRTPGALDAMSNVPTVQALFHFSILFLASGIIAIPDFLDAGQSDGIHPDSSVPFVTLPLAYLSGIVFLLLCHPLSLYVQRVSVLLKDLSPILRLLLQVLFWSTPMVYVINRPDILEIMSWNPLFCMVDVQRFLTYGLPMQSPAMYGIVWLAILSAIAGLLSRFRLREVSADFL